MLGKQHTDDTILEQCNALTEADVKVEFVACQLRVAPDLQNAIMSSRLSTNAVYPFLSGRLRTFSMANGLTEFDQDYSMNGSLFACLWAWSTTTPTMGIT